MLLVSVYRYTVMVLSIYMLKQAFLNIEIKSVTHPPPTKKEVVSHPVVSHYRMQ